MILRGLGLEEQRNRMVFRTINHDLSPGAPMPNVNFTQRMLSKKVNDLKNFNYFKLFKKKKLGNFGLAIGKENLGKIW